MLCEVLADQSRHKCADDESENTAGVIAGFSTADLDGEFDPAAWDAKMSAVFGSEFYSDADAAAADVHLGENSVSLFIR